MTNNNMTKNEENLEEKKIDNDIDNDLEELKEEISQIEEISEKDESGTKIETEEILKLKELLARTQADYQNFKMRTERDREDMIFFLKYDIFKKILPRVDDLERMIKNTPENEKTQVLYEWILALEKALKRDLDMLWVKPFDSIWSEVDPSKHEVVSQIPSETPWIIIDELEKWYILGDRVLRVAKVIVWV